MGYVAVPHGVELDSQELFYAHVHLHGGPAPVRRFLPELLDLVCNGKINPGKVFDLEIHGNGKGRPAAIVVQPREGPAQRGFMPRSSGSA